MRKYLSLTFVTLVCIAVPATAQRSYRSQFSTEIEAGKKATHIGQITNHTLLVITGSTYSFTVDTPEDRGLVSTSLGVAQLPHQITSKDGSAQRYQVTDKDGVAKNDGEII